jgi:hypothetical protein
MDIIAALLSFTCQHIPKITVEPVCTYIHKMLSVRLESFPAVGFQGYY